MSLDSLIFLDVVSQASFVLSAVAFFLLSLLFGDTLLLRFDLRTFVKFLGFLLLGISFLFVAFHNSYPSLSFWMSAVALVLIFIGFIVDPLSRLQFLAPLPIVFFPFLTGHILLFVLDLMITVGIFQLAYTTRHRDFIPLGVGFTLISIGEYFFHLKDVVLLKELASAGSFLYLFASLILLGWVWSYLAIRFIHVSAGEKSEELSS